MDEHKRILSEVLKLLSAVGLKLNLKKCKFAYTEINYLGYCVSKEGNLRVNNKKESNTDVNQIIKPVGTRKYC